MLKIFIGPNGYEKNKDSYIFPKNLLLKIPTRTFNIGYIKTSKNKYINELKN